MEQIKFVIPGEPIGKGRPRFNRATGRTYTPDKTAKYENLVKVEYQMQCEGVKFEDDAMLDMRILAYYSIPQSASKKKKAMMEAGLIRPTKTPDVDNICKILCDALNKIAYRDDAQVVDCQVRKFYSSEPRVVVLIQNVSSQ